MNNAEGKNKLTSALFALRAKNWLSRTAAFLSKNENVNWLEDGFTIAVRCVSPQRPHPSIKVAGTQTSQD